jgi:hypothetical protein
MILEDVGVELVYGGMKERVKIHVSDWGFSPDWLTNFISMRGRRVPDRLYGFIEAPP